METREQFLKIDKLLRDAHNALAQSVLPLGDYTEVSDQLLETKALVSSKFAALERSVV